VINGSGMFTFTCRLGMPQALLEIFKKLFINVLKTRSSYCDMMDFF
jgi:hypothetical protein